jgi:superfamily II DNA/RNA helicase
MEVHGDKIEGPFECKQVYLFCHHRRPSPGQTDKGAELFKSGDLSILIATDVASELHIDGITHVIAMTSPRIPRIMFHRIGRTARAGAGSKASSGCENYVLSLHDIRWYIRKKIPSLPVTVTDLIKIDYKEKVSTHQPRYAKKCPPSSWEKKACRQRLRNLPAPRSGSKSIGSAGAETRLQT